MGADGLDLAFIHDDRAFTDNVFVVPERQDAVGANQDSAHGRLRKAEDGFVPRPVPGVALRIL